MMCALVFFFKQKTAYEMRISDWSSDVCSSDLLGPFGPTFGLFFLDRVKIFLLLRLQQPADLGIDFFVPGGHFIFHGFLIGSRPFGQVLFDQFAALMALFAHRWEEYTSELLSLIRISYSYFCFHNKNTTTLTYN